MISPFFQPYLSYSRPTVPAPLQYSEPLYKASLGIDLANSERYWSLDSLKWKKPYTSRNCLASTSSGTLFGVIGSQGGMLERGSSAVVRISLGKVNAKEAYGSFGSSSFLVSCDDGSVLHVNGSEESTLIKKCHRSSYIGSSLTSAQFGESTLKGDVSVFDIAVGRVIFSRKKSQHAPVALHASSLFVGEYQYDTRDVSSVVCHQLHPACLSFAPQKSRTCISISVCENYLSTLCTENIARIYDLRKPGYFVSEYSVPTQCDNVLLFGGWLAVSGRDLHAWLVEPNESLIQYKKPRLFCDGAFKTTKSSALSKIGIAPSWNTQLETNSTSVEFSVGTANIGSELYSVTNFGKIFQINVNGENICDFSRRKRRTRAQYIDTTQVDIPPARTVASDIRARVVANVCDTVGTVMGKYICSLIGLEVVRVRCSHNHGTPRPGSLVWNKCVETCSWTIKTPPDAPLVQTTTVSEIILAVLKVYGCRLSEYSVIEFLHTKNINCTDNTFVVSRRVPSVPTRNCNFQRSGDLCISSLFDETPYSLISDQILQNLTHTSEASVV